MKYLVACILLITTPLSGQTTGDDTVADSLFDQLGAALVSTDVPPTTICEPYRNPLRRLCLGAIATKRTELTDDKSAALEAERQLRAVVADAPEWAAGWYALALARLQLGLLDVRSREGPLQGLGLSWEAGAGNALIRAFELDTTNLSVLSALALAPIPPEGAGEVQDRVDVLRRHRTALAPVVLAATAAVERLAGSRDSAVTLWRAALAGGGADSGVVAIELARDLFATGRPIEGTNVLLSGASTESESGRQAYERELRRVADSLELVDWEGTPAAQRPTWLRKFWAGRDVRDGLADGERLVVHYGRLEEALDAFRLTIPSSGRHLVRSFATAFDRLPPGGEAAKYFVPDSREADWLGPFSRLSEWSSTATEMDDRGAIWVRHGKPDDRRFTSGGLAMEAWLYVRGVDAGLVLFFIESDFDGQSGASVLVPTPAGLNGLGINQLCGGGGGFCDELLRYGAPAGVWKGIASNGAALAGAGQIADARAVGRERIQRATTTDAAPLRFPRSLEPLVQIYGVRARSMSRPIALAAFAIPADRLLGTQPAAAAGRTVYSIQMRLSLLDRAGRRFDVDTTRHFVVSRPLEKGQFLTGTLELVVPPGIYQSSLLLTQADGGGALAAIPRIEVPDIGQPLALSSVILGLGTGSTAWNSGTQVVALNPLGAFAEGSEAELYYQATGLKSGERYTTTLEFFTTDRPNKSDLTLTFESSARHTAEEVQRTIGLKNLKPGRYQLQVSIEEGDRTATQSALLTVVGH